MDIRLRNATGKKVYYKVLDYEGPFVNFAEDRLPGMYPDTQSDYTTSDDYYSGTNTKIGNRRYGLFSRYPRFSQPKTYMSNFNDGQLPSERSYEEVRHNYPGSTDGNYEGVIMPGKVRDLMLRDCNCNLYFCSYGPPMFSKINQDNFSEPFGGFVGRNNKLQPNDPRVFDYEAIIKVARLKETHVVLALRFQGWNYTYDASGVRVVTDYPEDCTFIGLVRVNKLSSESPRRLSLANPYPFANIDTLPSPNGTYIDQLRRDAMQREQQYSRQNPNMTAYNYSNDYDKPILGYFDRRWLYRNDYIK